jgi:hypothetical protein
LTVQARKADETRFNGPPLNAAEDPHHIHQAALIAGASMEPPLNAAEDAPHE